MAAEEGAQMKTAVIVASMDVAVQMEAAGIVAAIEAGAQMEAAVRRRGSWLRWRRVRRSTPISSALSPPLCTA